MNERPSLRPPIEIGHQASPVVAVVIELDSTMADADIARRVVFPEIYPGDTFVAEPDGLVVLVADRIGMAQPGQIHAGRTDKGKDERPRGNLAKLVAGAFDTVDAKTGAADLRNGLNPRKNG